MAKYKIDKIDQKILTYLIKNARMPFLEIARECGISGAAIHQRVKKLEDAGIITGSRLEVNPKELGHDVCAYVGIQISESKMFVDVIDSLKRLPEVVECHFITGKYSLFIKLFCKNNNELMHFMTDTLYAIPGITTTETFFSLDQSFERQVSISTIELTPKGNK